MSGKVEYKHYKSIDFITLYCYSEAERTGDFRYLLKFDDYEELPDIDTTYLSSVWDELKLGKQEIELKLSRRNKNLFTDQVYIFDLQKKLTRVHSLVALLGLKDYHKDEHYLKELSKEGYRLNPKKDYFDELVRIKKQSMNIQTKISLKHEEMMSKLGPVKEGEEVSIYKTIESIEDYTKKDIDIHKITMRKWLEKLHRVNEEITRKSMKNG